MYIVVHIDQKGPTRAKFLNETDDRTKLVALRAGIYPIWAQEGRLADEVRTKHES